MNTETLSGLMGLGGTLVGAGVSLCATIITLRHQAQTEFADKVDERGRAAGEKALTELYAVRRHLEECSHGSVPDERQPWRKIAQDHLDEADLAVSLMPQAEELRDRMREVFSMTFFDLGTESGSPWEHADFIQGATLEAIRLLSAYMRGDPLPQRSARVTSFLSRPAWER